MEKAQSKKTATVKRPMSFPMINFGKSFIDRLKSARVNMNTSGISALGKQPKNLFFYHGTGSQNKTFKSNQRRERKLSKRRKTPINARN